MDLEEGELAANVPNSKTFFTDSKLMHNKICEDLYKLKITSKYEYEQDGFVYQSSLHLMLFREPGMMSQIEEVKRFKLHFASGC